MSGGDHVSDRHGDAAAYALGALEPAEVDAFRRHLTGCAACREEVAAFEHVVDVLPAAAPRYAVPKGLRGRVMREVRSTPKAGAGASASRRPPLFAFRPKEFLAGGVLAVVVVAVLFGLVLRSGTSHTRVIQASVTGLSGSAEVVISGNHANLITRGLSQLPAGRVYEMWLQIGNGPPMSTETLFSVTKSGTASVGVPLGVNGVRYVLVTREPAGGSAAPTSPPVIVARLS